MTIIQQNDAAWLSAAARLGMRGRPASRPNPSVGVIIVKNDRVVGRGWTQKGGRPHAEAVALAHAGEAARGATLYSSLEPCAHKSDRGPACSDLVAKSGVVRVVYGCEDPDPRTAGHGAAKIRDGGATAELGHCEEATASLAGYLKQHSQNRPHVTLKLAVSLDGFIALPSGESQWITGPVARAHVHSRRAMADAILVGGNTWRDDAPGLDVRLPGLEDRSPERLVLSRSYDGTEPRGISSPEEIRTLGDVQYLYVEGGAGAAAAFLTADLVDRIDLYRAPIVIGSGKAAIGDIGLQNLGSAHGRWSLRERRMLGSDTYEAYERTA